MLSQLDKTSSLFIYANGLLMLTVVVFPYSTSVLGRFLNTAYLTLPVVLYCFTNFIHNVGWLAVSVVATHPKDLTKGARHKANVQKARKVIAIGCVFNLLVTILAFWLPIPALLLVTAAWIVYLFAGIFGTSLEEACEGRRKRCLHGGSQASTCRSVAGQRGRRCVHDRLFPQSA